MVHQHGARHLERRQRHDFFQEEEEDGPVEETVFVTMPNTFAATEHVVMKTMTENNPKSAVGGAVQLTRTLLPPAVRTRPSEEEETEKATPTASAKHSSRTAEVTSHASSHASLHSTLKIDTASSPEVTASSFIGTVVAGVTSVAASASASASASSSAEAASSGMSGGAKAGLVLGILVGIGALLGAILFFAHRKKRERVATAQQSVDNEKATSMRSMPPPPVAKEPTAQPNAPRLSLRPVTEFDPAFPNRKSGANLLGAAAAGAAVAGAAAATGNRSPSPSSPRGPWERPGASNAANPFRDPQAPSNSPPQDPFSNNAAIETPRASASATPQTFNAEFGNPAPAIAAAEKAPVAAPLPKPPTVNTDKVPSSPAWTDDLPASPGPAPSGPLPVAAAGGAPPAPNNVHRIQLDFVPSMGDELELRAGQLVRMLHEYDDGWALCVRLDRSQQGVVPRTCLSKHPVKPRQGPPRNGPPGPPRMQGPRPNGPDGIPMGHAGVPQPRPLSPANNGRSSPHPPAISPAGSRMSPAPRSMSPGPRQMPPPQGRARSNSNAPYAGQPRSMSPGPYGGGPQMAPPPQMGRPRANSASQIARRQSPPGPSPMNPTVNPDAPMQMPVRKPIPGQAL
ncbi:hypothetical protein P171DRAFT_266326 [Karstenula rhodostoma CBS 690.94]|uniref:SH3 domain-containing protein n=1 Tax=Karstenula rhodostoma CBS 690.94 TaxID=1392251 RepID=A0A9P4PKA1_9PLEO|nr:hypothetical protein P171DRAFT_266326 [Karstenula rhodostoma CBS 690.94]